MLSPFWKPMLLALFAYNKRAPTMRYPTGVRVPFCVIASVGVSNQ